MIIDNKLKRDSIFAIGNGKTDVLLLVIPFPPSQLKPAHRNTLINFDPKFKLITYGEFIFSEEEDVAGVNTTFKEIKLKFSNGFFKKTR